MYEAIYNSLAENEEATPLATKILMKWEQMRPQWAQKMHQSNQLLPAVLQAQEAVDQGMNEIEEKVSPQDPRWQATMEILMSQWVNLPDLEVDEDQADTDPAII